MTSSDKTETLPKSSQMMATFAVQSLIILDLRANHNSTARKIAFPATSRVEKRPRTALLPANLNSNSRLLSNWRLSQASNRTKRASKILFHKGRSTLDRKKRR